MNRAIRKIRNLLLFCDILEKEFMFISCTYIHVNKQSPRDDHQDNYITSQVKTWWGHGWQKPGRQKKKKII